MLGNIIKREIRHHVLSLRLHLLLILIMLLFGLGTTAFVKTHAMEKAKYERYYTNYIERSRQLAESNLSQYAIQTKSLVLKPLSNSFITDAKEKYLPNSFRFNVYNVFGFHVESGAANPYVNSFQELNWVFIIAILISFAVLIFSYDIVSGEKQTRTLALTLSNSVPRGMLI